MNWFGKKTESKIELISQHLLNINTRIETNAKIQDDKTTTFYDDIKKTTEQLKPGITAHELRVIAFLIKKLIGTQINHLALTRDNMNEEGKNFLDKGIQNKKIKQVIKEGLDDGWDSFPASTTTTFIDEEYQDRYNKIIEDTKEKQKPVIQEIENFQNINSELDGIIKELNVFIWNQKGGKSKKVKRNSERKRGSSKKKRKSLKKKQGSKTRYLIKHPRNAVSRK